MKDQEIPNHVTSTVWQMSELHQILFVTRWTKNVQHLLPSSIASIREPRGRTNSNNVLLGEWTDQIVPILNT
ncbi:hypothetical protein GDO78_017947 [Eleutherodactylus coqui]|uniref:Uncharacterized protein n=1 Tax=Eleutherodactylus coqui TaxID=57060 RepID=A0A8J6BD30_ELECQ|nr:hypothetical protein GDO78_017947 [Eleutherodactylus coqui]